MTLKLLTRSITLLIAAVAGMAAILVVPGFTYPSGVHPGALIDWWEGVGTPSATLVVLRSVMLALMAYVAVAALWVTAAVIATLGARPPSLPRLIAPSVRRYLAGGSIVVAALAPSALAAQDGPPIYLVDLGPVEAPGALASGAEPAMIAIDLGPAFTSQSAQHPLSLATKETDTSSLEGAVDSIWEVSRGDHLWSIAAETVSEHRANASDEEIATYWRRLIDTNRDAVGSDPDLISPGQRIVLPPL